MSESLFYLGCRSQVWNFIKKEILVQVFSCEFCEISENTFFTEHLYATVSFLPNEFTNFWKWTFRCNTDIKVCKDSICYLET